MVNAQEQILKFKEFIETNLITQLHAMIKKGGRSLVVSFADLARFDLDLADDLLGDPEETIKACEVAMQQFDITESLQYHLCARFCDLPVSQNVNIRDIRSEHIDKFVAVQGIVRQASDVRPQVVSAKFECPSCGNIMTLPQIETVFREPSRCSCGRKGKFRVVHKEMVDAQRLVLEESSESLEGGEQPKRLSVFLREDLVEPKMEKRTTPGSKVKAFMVVKEVPLQAKTGGQLTRYDLIGESNFIQPIEEAYQSIEISPEDEERIKQLAKDPKIYEKLTASIAPSVYGHDDIKGSLILQLMGGVRKERTDGTVVKGDVHILLVGDPGAAKSTILTYMSKVAPKARYVAGRSATSAGLTASVVKDEFLKGWALEAGAIVLANGGFLMIDEMDKMSQEDTSALHEAMAQQQVTISKANIQATLSAKTTVLAAANPKFGRFDPYQPIASQINLPPTLINRFDLIFPVRDLPNKEKDSKIASHILETHQTGGLEPDIPVDLMKKYIAYARQQIMPKLSPEAVEEIKNFYVGLRNSGTFGEEGVKPIPISARQLEALIRLAEASARVRLAKVVTKADAKRAIAILNHCLMQVGFDSETGQIDIDRIYTGVPASTRNKIRIIRDIINDLEAQGKKTIPLEEVIAEAAEKNLTEAQVEEIIEKLKREGEIFEPRRGWVSKI